MSDDLKEIIEHINESHKGEEISNPVSLINVYINNKKLIVLLF